MNVNQMLNLLHEDFMKERDWGFFDQGILNGLLDTLEIEFPQYLYKDSNRGLNDIGKGKSFELTLISVKQGESETAAIMPSIYFDNKGYDEIVSYIDKHVQKKFFG